jgi:hypothetical protein
MPRTTPTVAGFSNYVTSTRWVQTHALYTGLQFAYGCTSNAPTLGAGDDALTTLACPFPFVAGCPILQGHERAKTRLRACIRGAIVEVYAVFVFLAERYAGAVDALAALPAEREKAVASGALFQNAALEQAVAPGAETRERRFLARCPAKGLVIHGGAIGHSAIAEHAYALNVPGHATRPDKVPPGAIPDNATRATASASTILITAPGHQREAQRQCKPESEYVTHCQPPGFEHRTLLTQAEASGVPRRFSQ